MLPVSSDPGDLMRYLAGPRNASLTLTYLTFCFRRLQVSQAWAVLIRLSAGTFGRVMMAAMHHPMVLRGVSVVIRQWGMWSARDWRPDKDEATALGTGRCSNFRPWVCGLVHHRPRPG